MSLETMWRDFKQTAMQGLFPAAAAGVSDEHREYCMKLIRFGFFAGAHATIGTLLKISEVSESEFNDTLLEFSTEVSAWADEVARSEFKT